VSKIGRPSKRTPETEARILDGLSAGITLTELCEADDMPTPQAVCRWKREDEAFRAMIATAISSGVEVMADRMVDSRHRHTRARPRGSVTKAKPSNPIELAYIYALTDPDTGEVRYIGKANSPKKRYIQHCSPGGLRGNTRRQAWLRSLAAKGKRPGVMILEVCLTRDWRVAEVEWIASGIGTRLTNGTPGGDQPTHAWKQSRLGHKNGEWQRLVTQASVSARWMRKQGLHEKADLLEAKIKLARKARKASKVRS
jgi:hypothetical protein